MPGFLFILIGVQILLIGFEVIKIKWEKDEARQKYKKLFLRMGFLLIVAGVVRLLI